MCSWRVKIFNFKKERKKERKKASNLSREEFLGLHCSYIRWVSKKEIDHSSKFIHEGFVELNNALDPLGAWG